MVEAVHEEKAASDDPPDEERDVVDARHTVRGGAHTYLTKPISGVDLRMELQAYFDGRQPPLRVFLCHSSTDKLAVRKLYRRLVRDGIDVWLDEKRLIPGKNWDLEIKKAVRQSDIIIVCLSQESVTKEGYVQREIRMALDMAEEKPDELIFLIPAELQECTVPDRLQRWQWVNLFESGGYPKLLGALRARAGSIPLRFV